MYINCVRISDGQFSFWPLAKFAEKKKKSCFLFFHIVCGGRGRFVPCEGQTPIPQTSFQPTFFSTNFILVMQSHSSKNSPKLSVANVNSNEDRFDVSIFFF